MWIKTQMTNNEKPRGFALTPEEHVKATLEKLGHDEWTNGHWKHSLQVNLLSWIPDKIFQKRLLSEYRKKD